MRGESFIGRKIEKPFPLLLGLGVLGGFSQPKGLTPQEEGQKWAVVVGIDRYQSVDLPSLHYAVSDAKAFAETWVQAAHFPRDHVFLLTSEARMATGQPTKANIVQAMEQVRTRGQKEGVDQVIFYCSGHGWAVTEKGGERAGGADGAGAAVKAGGGGVDIKAHSYLRFTPICGRTMLSHHETNF